MARFFSIIISGTGPLGATSIYLTHNGMVGGRVCQTEIPEADILISASSGNTTVGNTGAPFTEKPLAAGKGRAFRIRFPKDCPSTLYSLLRTLIDYVDAQNTELRLQASGTPGSIDVQFTPNHAPVPIGFTGFSTANVKGLELRGITAAVNP